MLIVMPSFIKAQFLGYFKLQKMNYAGNTEIIRKHFHDHQENLCIAVLSITISFAKKNFIFKVIFIQEVFKNIQGLLWKTQGLFKHITQFFTRVFYQHEVYLQITRYEMTQSSCKRDTKSKSHPGMRLAPVPVFSRKHPLIYTT